jgi:hypothetical protein
LALGALLAAAGCQDYNFNPVGHCLIEPGLKRVELSTVTTADVLFVVDDSGSMGAEQASLAANFDQFINALNDGNVARVAEGLKPIDFHLAVTTTSVFLNDQVGAECRKDCPGATGQVCCTMSGSGTTTTPFKPELTYRACTGASDTSCEHGDACRQDCDGHSGEWICCNPTSKAVTEDQLISCPTEKVPCGEIKTHYLWNPAKPGCTAGVASNGALYPQGSFVGAGTNPRVLHFDKSLYECTSSPCTNQQGYTADELIQFFKQNIQVGTCGSGEEQGFQASKLALQKALAGQQRDTRSTSSKDVVDVAAEWPHKDSKLVVVYVGDEDDCSSPQDPAKGVVLVIPPPPAGSANGTPPTGPDSCEADTYGQRFEASTFVDYFADAVGKNPLGAAFIVSAKSSSSESACQDETCLPGICCDRACSQAQGLGDICSTTTCGGQAAGTRFLDAAAQFRTKSADVVAGSICDQFGPILARIGEIVKPPTGLVLPTQPASSDISVLRIAKSDGKTRKTCKGPAPAGLTAAQAGATDGSIAGAPFDWWFTAGAQQLTDEQRATTAASKYVYINHDTRNCEANSGETYSMEYIARLPSTGCSGATAQEADDYCAQTLQAKAGEYTCYAGTDDQGYCTVPTGGAVVGTCVCGSRFSVASGVDPRVACTPRTGVCPWGCAEDSEYCPMVPRTSSCPP